MKIIFRVDASQQIGSGHVMRCLTLAEALSDLGGSVEFITRAHPGNMNEYISSKGFKVHSLPIPPGTEIKQGLSGYEHWLVVTQEGDADSSIQVLADTQVDWLIVDHYALGHAWEEKLRPFVRKIMVIDDLANRQHDCDVLLDQNYIHDCRRYEPLLLPATTQLLGPGYALLRKDFAKNRCCNAREYGVVNNIFVFFGGSDPDNMTSIALRALTRPDLKHLLVDVVIGSANPNFIEVRALVTKHPNARLHVQVENIVELMCKSDVALGAGGTTTWERLAAGLPSIVVTIAENQVALIRDLDQDGYLKWLGNAVQMDSDKMHDALLEVIRNPHQLQTQSRKGQKLIDGMGVRNTARLLLKGPEIDTLTVRKAKATDCLLYWYWANDPVVRLNAFNQQAIKWEDHQSWFKKRSNDPDTILLVIECQYGPIGQVRFDRTDTHFMISYSIVRQFRGVGLGNSMLKIAINYLQPEEPITLIGDVRETNVASRKIFEQLGFSESTLPPRKGALRYQLLFDPSKQNGEATVQLAED